MKLSDRLKSHEWKSSSLAPGDHAWDYSEDPASAARLLDRCEELFRDLLSCAGKTEPVNETLWARIRAMLAELRGRAIGGEMAIYYILEDTKLRPLPFNVEAAVEVLREEFIAGHTQGVLCVRDTNGNAEGETLRARGHWAAFEPEARPWLTRAIDLVLIRQGRS